MGCFKVCTVVQGFKENKLYLDGPDFNYTANICELAAVQNLLFEPHNSLHNNDSTPHPANDNEMIAMCDVATAYLQTDMFKLTNLVQYLKVYDPMLGVWCYFQQIRNLYSSSSAGKRWEKTLIAWLTLAGTDFIQGKNEKSAFFARRMSYSYSPTAMVSS